MTHIFRFFAPLLSLTLMVIAPASGLQASDVVSKISDSYESSDAYWNGINSTIRSKLNIPFYFNALYGGFSPLSEELRSQRASRSSLAPVLFNYRELSQRNSLKTSAENELGLRLITVRSDNRKATAQALAESGVFETGDIVLSFRPEWYTTLRYSHIQLGISHAGLLYFAKGSDGKRYLKNLDMPMDTDHVGEGYLNSKHYLGAPFLHVVRARNLDAKQKSNLEKWLALLAVRGPKAYKDKKILFNQDYAAPNYRHDEPMKFVGDIGRIALNQRLTTPTAQYCSEFAWSILSLRDCDPSDPTTVSAFSQQSAPVCIKEIFKPMPVFGNATTADETSAAETSIGLADGIPLIAQSQYHYEENLKRRSNLQARLIRMMVFNRAKGAGARISQGHLAVEQSLGDDFFNAASNYYTLITKPEAENNPMVHGLRQAINSQQLPNYSPTAYMVHTLLSDNSPIRAFDYVGTLFYAGKMKSSGGRELDIYDSLRGIQVD